MAGGRRTRIGLLHVGDEIGHGLHIASLLACGFSVFDTSRPDGKFKSKELFPHCDVGP